jgi:hypothetical protein
MSAISLVNAAGTPDLPGAPNQEIKTFIDRSFGCNGALAEFERLIGMLVA